MISVACDELDEWSRAIVTRCAKDQNRPDAFIGVEAKEVEVRTYPKRKRRKGGRKKLHKPVITKRWEPVTRRRFARRATSISAGTRCWRASQYNCRRS